HHLVAASLELVWDRLERDREAGGGQIVSGGLDERRALTVDRQQRTNPDTAHGPRHGESRRQDARYTKTGNANRPPDRMPRPQTGGSAALPRYSAARPYRVRSRPGTRPWRPSGRHR